MAPPLARLQPDLGAPGRGGPIDGRGSARPDAGARGRGVHRAAPQGQHRPHSRTDDRHDLHREAGATGESEIETILGFVWGAK